MTGRRAAALLPAALVWLAAPLPALPAPADDLTPVLRPGFEGMDRAVREIFSGALERLDGLLTDPDASRADLLDAFGELGELYLVYTLPEAAESCFVNARRLAPGEFRWPYLLGSIYQERGDFEAAAGQLEAALAARPGDPAATLRLAQVRFELGDLDGAAAGFADVAGTPGFEAAGRYGLGRVAAVRGRYREAAEHLEAAVSAQPGASEPRYQLAVAYRELGEVERAREQLAAGARGRLQYPDPETEGLGRGARGAGIFIVTGSRARARGDLVEAAEAFRRAVAEDPGDVSHRRILASTLIESGDTEGAVAEYREILKLAPDDASTLYNLGTALVRLGRTDEAAAHYRRAADADPEHADARVNLAALLEQEGRLEEARALYSEAAAIRPYDLDLEIRLAAVGTRLGAAGEAREKLLEILAQEPASSEALLALAEAEAALGFPDRALAALERVQGSASPPETRARAHFLAAGLLRDRGGDEALGHLRQAAELAPGARPVRFALAQALGGRGDYAGAAAEFRTLARRDPDDEGAWFGAALALLLGGRDGEARRTLDEGLAALPASLPLRHLLARLLAGSADPAVRDGERALRLAREVFESQQTLEHAETLAMAHAELGQFDQALEWQRQILERARAGAPPEKLAQLERRRALYERGEPCRSPWLADRELD